MSNPVERAAIEQIVRDYVLSKFLVDEGPEALTESTPLITGGVLNSIRTLQLVQFLEKQYGIRFQAHELSADYLDTVGDIVDRIQEKLAPG